MTEPDGPDDVDIDETGTDERTDGPETGSGDGGTLGTPGTDLSPAGAGGDDTMVVSGGGVADAEEG